MRKNRFRLAIYFIFSILLTLIVFYVFRDTIRPLIILALFISFFISVFETINKREVFILLTNLKTIKENFYIVLERFFKIFIPLFLILNIFVTVFIEIKPKLFISEKALFHYEMIIFMVVLFIFSTYSIVNLNFRQNQLRAFEEQAWIANNLVANNRNKHFEKIDIILEHSFELLSPKSSSSRRKSIWILIPDYDPESQNKIFRKAHFKCLDSDIHIYTKLMNGNVPFLNIEEWINACDELYEIIKRGEDNTIDIKNEYHKYRTKRNEFSSAAGYVYLRNLKNPLLSKVGEEDCLFFNDKYLSLYEKELERIKYNWRSMVVWNIVYERKKIGVLFFLDTARYGFRPAHRLILKSLSNILAPIIYRGIKDKYYGEKALEMLNDAIEIDSEDVIIKELGERFKSHEWKKEITEIRRFCKRMGKLEGGY